jgi:hypothetical protein
VLASFRSCYLRYFSKRTPKNTTEKLLIEAKAVSFLQKLIITHISSNIILTYHIEVIDRGQLLQKLLITCSSSNITLKYHRDVAGKNQGYQPSQRFFSPYFIL